MGFLVFDADDGQAERGPSRNFTVCSIRLCVSRRIDTWQVEVERYNFLLPVHLPAAYKIADNTQQSLLTVTTLTRLAC